MKVFACLFKKYMYLKTITVTKSINEKISKEIFTQIGNSHFSAFIP